MRKIFALLALAAATSAFAISASRVGPVSTYGELKANGGKLSGSCPAYQNQAVQVKGMSLFWSNGADSSTVFYSEKAVNLMVKEMNIEVLRFAMGVDKEKFEDQGRGYLSSTQGETLQKGYLKNVVNAAIDNDIYVIIDWHIESANGKTSEAAKFFEYAAKEYGSYNNVIFEVWNEPTGADMGTVASHANTVIASIRKYSDNLVLVGSPEWSSHPEQCASAGINDKNYACTLHFYAATHQVGNGGYNDRASQAISAGVPVFASEWGTVSADGNGGPNSGASSAWIDWLNQNHVSWANWSASAIKETSAAFQNLAIDNGLSYKESGTMVKGWMNGAGGYKDCGLPNGNASSNSGYSAGVANGAKTDLIDDFEDGDRYAYTGGWWSGFADSDDDTDGKGKTSITNGKWTNDAGKETYDVLMKSDGGKNTSKYVAGLTGIKLSQGSYKYAPYVGISVMLKKDTSDLDLSACKSISYKYKGASHNFRVDLPSKITNWNFHNVNKDASEDWKEVELTWDQFIQESWGDDDKHFSLDKGMNAVRGFAWQVKGALDVPDNMNQPKYDYLYIDDVRCNGASIAAITSAETPVAQSSASANPTSSATNPTSSATNPASSAAIVPASSSVVITAVVDIDDVEDGNEVLKTTGTWYAYTDKDPGGLSSITNTYDPELPGYVVVFPGATDPTNGTQGFVGLTGMHWDMGTYTEAPFVALGINMMADTSMGLDLSNCNALSYRYQGAAHQFKVQDGQVTDYAYHYVKQDDATEWTTVVIPWTKLEQPPWTEDPKDLNNANIKKMAWEVVGYKGFEAQPEIDHLYVDDLKCVNQTVGIKAARAASGLKLALQGGMLYVNTEKSGAVRIQVFDMMGNVVKSVSENMTAGMHQVSLENMSNGNYVVRVMVNGAAKTARISIK